MKLARRRTEPIKETQMVSLADIAFLIIFFFMLTSTFMRDRLSVVLPALARTSRTESPVTVIVDREGKIYLNGQHVGSPGTLEAELKGIMAARGGAKDREVRLRCDKKLVYKDYRGVYQAISHAGGVIAIMHDLRR
jgi:biopolymer transport protein ExbD